MPVGLLVLDSPVDSDSLIPHRKRGREAGREAGGT